MKLYSSDEVQTRLMDIVATAPIKNLQQGDTYSFTVDLLAGSDDLVCLEVKMHRHQAFKPE